MKGLRTVHDPAMETCPAVRPGDPFTRHDLERDADLGNGILQCCFCDERIYSPRYEDGVHLAARQRRAQRPAAARPAPAPKRRLRLWPWAASVAGVVFLYAQARGWAT